MIDTKSIFASRGVLGGFAALVAGVIGFDLPADEATSILEAALTQWDAVLAIVGGGIAIYGRIKAIKRIA